MSENEVNLDKLEQERIIKTAKKVGICIVIIFLSFLIFLREKLV